MTYPLGVCIGGEVVEMDIWSRIFAEKFRIIFKVFIRMDRGERVSQMRIDVERGEGVKNPLWMAPKVLGSRFYIINKPDDDTFQKVQSLFSFLLYICLIARTI